MNQPPSTASNAVPTNAAPSATTFNPTYTNTQYPNPLPPPSTQQQPPSTYTGPTNQFPAAFPPPTMPSYNFAAPNPNPQQHQQYQHQQYFQPVPPTLFSDSQQYQQPPFQFNPAFNTYPNTLNAFPAPPTSSPQQAARASPFAPNDHHSHDHDAGGHGHSHDHGAHGHSHDH